MKNLALLCKTAFAAILLPAVSGCTSIAVGYGADAAYSAAFREKIVDASKLSAQEQSTLQHVKVIESIPGGGGTPKGELVGLACKLTVAVLIPEWVWKPELGEANGLNPEDAARTQLRIKAMQTGANTVVAPSCTHKEGIDWGNNCFESWRCTAQAWSIP